MPGAGRGARAAALAAALGAPGAGAWRAAGNLPTGSHFKYFAGKFCFDFVPREDDAPRPDGDPQDGDPLFEQATTAAGILEAAVEGEVVLAEPAAVASDEISGEQSSEGQLLFLIFDDEEEHWQQAQARWDTLSCEEIQALSSDSFPLSGALARDHRRQIGVEVHQAIRPRWWYFIFVNCGATIYSPIEYTLHARNPTHGFQSEFGMDADGSLPLQAAFFLLFSLAAAAACSATGLPGRRSVRSEATRSRPWVRLLQASSVLSALGCGLLAMHHLVFAFDGWGLRWASLLASLMACGAKLVLSALQLFIAGGWALLSSDDEQPARLRGTVCGAVAGIFLVTVFCELHQEFGRDAGSALYLYESWSGGVILMLNLGLLLISSLLMRETYQKERVAEAKAFYLLVSAATAVYYISLPVVCTLATLLSPWVRLKYVQRVELCTRFGVTLLLLRCLRPSHLDAVINSRLQGQPSLEQSSDSDSELEGAEGSQFRVAGGGGHKEDGPEVE